MTPVEKKLRVLYRQLSDPDKHALLRYAEFLLEAAQQSMRDEPARIAQPESIPRPDEESVVAAIKRLSASYPMLESKELLNESTMLMSQHILQGKEAIVVIDELEVLFRSHYSRYVSDNAQ